MTDLNRISLYVHIPFCETKCPYCDFNTYARIESLMPSYVAALQAEIRLWGDLLGHPAAHTVFFGGGTPSYLPSEDIEAVMSAVRAAFPLEPDAEVTLEANPGDFNGSKLESYLESGINRLSIGVQSLDDRLLKLLGRRHSSAQALEAYRMAVNAGFGNVSIDLMYGLPHQAADDWRRTVDSAVELSPSHISMYCLTLEGGTPMEQWVKLGQMPDPDPDLAADMYMMAQDAMRQHGYRHYEISNWAVPGFESRHNITYWRNEAYLGVGPGAHSYLRPHRFYNLKSPREYIRLLQGNVEATVQSPLRDATDGHAPLPDTIHSIPVVETVEPIGKALEMSETLMMGLRLDTGISIEEFSRRFDGPPADFYPDTIAELTSLGLLESANGSLRLTQRGRMFGNQVFSRFFI
jgi:oxygen-independent coproporphyrinogen-3 oxidase